MANTDAPRGARPMRHLAGGVNRMREFTIASGYNTTIFSGDFVKLVAGGGIELAAAGNRLLGVFAGVRWVDSEGNQQFNRRWIAGTTGTEIVAFVYADPLTTFSIQSDGVLAAADVGTLADFISTHAGNNSTGQSGQEFSSAGIGTGAANLRLLGREARPDNDWGANVDVEVQIFEHEFSTGAPGTPGV